MKFKKFAAVILMSVMIGSMSLSGCGINKNATAVTMTGDAIDTIEVDMGYANFAARIQQASYDSIFASYYGEDYWTNESYAQDGKNMQESIKDSVMENIETQCLLEAHMDDYGVEITDDEKAVMKEAAEKFMSDNTKSALKEVGATEEYVERYLYLQTVQRKMSTAIRATADTEVSDEEAAQRTFSYVKISLTTYTDDSGNQQTYTEDQVTVVKKDAYDAAEKAKTDCYYIIRLDSEFDSDATEKKKQSIISDRQDEAYNNAVESYKKDIDINVNDKEWSKVAFDNLFTTPSASDSSSATAE